MAVLVLVMGDSGSGKSASLRSFTGKEASVFNVANKPLPFKNTGENKLPLVPVKGYDDLAKNLMKARNKSLIIDDAQYLMSFEFFDSAEEKGFEKFTRMGKHFYNVIELARSKPQDVIIYFFMHIEHEDGFEKVKTLGRMLDEKLCLEGLFTISLKTVIRENSNGGRDYLFSTRTNGYDSVKTPMGMFEKEFIPNDLKIVDKAIREYYEIADNEILALNTKSEESKSAPSEKEGGETEEDLSDIEEEMERAWEDFERRKEEERGVKAMMQDEGKKPSRYSGPLLGEGDVDATLNGGRDSLL